MRRLIESGAIPGRNFVQLGLRGYWPERETFEWPMDVVEVSRPYDQAKITAQNANRCILDAISARAVNKSRGGKP